MPTKSEPEVDLERDAQRPRTRGDCKNGIRPCPWVGCRHHLSVEVTLSGSIRANGLTAFPQKRVGKNFDKWSDELVDSLMNAKQTCSLDIADAGKSTLQTLSDLFDISRERARQVEQDALHYLKQRIEISRR